MPELCIFLSAFNNRLASKKVVIDPLPPPLAYAASCQWLWIWQYIWRFMLLHRAGVLWSHEEGPALCREDSGRSGIALLVLPMSGCPCWLRLWQHRTRCKEVLITMQLMVVMKEKPFCSSAGCYWPYREKKNRGTGDDVLLLFMEKGIPSYRQDPTMVIVKSSPA